LIKDTIQQYVKRLNASNIANRMLSGAFWSFTGTALGKFLVLITGIICARILGKEQFGALGMVRSTIGMFIILGAGGIGVTATRFIASYRGKEVDHAASIYKLSTLFSLILAIVTGLLLIGFIGLLAERVLKSADLNYSLIIGITVLFFSILNSSENGTLAGLEDFKSIAINTLVGSFVEAVGMVIGAYYWQVEGAIAGFGIGILVMYICNKYSAKKGLHKLGIKTSNQHIRKEDWKVLYKYSIPATLSALTVTPVYWFIRSMLVRSDGYGELGIFEAADQWKVIILFVPGAISQIVLPIMSSINDSKQFHRTLIGNLLMIGSVSASLAVIIWLMAPSIMPLYGKSFSDMGPLTWLAISTIPTALAQIMEMTMYSRDKVWLSLVFNILWGVSTILFSYIFLQSDLGAKGLAMAIVASYMIKMIFMGGFLTYSFKKGGIG